MKFACWGVTRQANAKRLLRKALHDFVPLQVPDPAHADPDFQGPVIEHQIRAVEGELVRLVRSTEGR